MQITLLLTLGLFRLTLTALLPNQVKFELKHQLLGLLTEVA